MKKHKKTNGQPAPAAPKAATTPRQDPSPDEIRDRAYKIFLARGGQSGHAIDDWLTAERELRTPRS